MAWVCTEKDAGSVMVSGESVRVIICNHNWGLIDRGGKYVLRPQFDDVGEWSDGMISVTTAKYIKDSDGLPYVDLDSPRSGFVDETGHLAVSPRFFGVGRFSEGLAAVAVSGGQYAKCGFINKAGRIVIKPRFQCMEDVHEELYAEIFSEGLCSVMLGGKIGYIDKSGKFVIKPRFGATQPFSQGLACISYADHREDYVEPPHEGG